jgi:hypothetical protein
MPMTKYDFDFSESEEGWSAGFADYDFEQPDEYQLQQGLRERPALIGNGKSLFISGMNRSDDLFMFYKRRLTGLRPSAAYKATFQVSLASKYVSRSGIGGDPAKSVYLKVCSSAFEPKLIQSDGTYRLDIDIGRQSSAGSNSTVLGDIQKPHDGTDEYALIARKSSKALLCTAAADGSIWILFGTDSGYEGETALYYIDFKANFDPQ